jgi:hypothetical protein
MLFPPYKANSLIISVLIYLCFTLNPFYKPADEQNLFLNPPRTSEAGNINGYRDLEFYGEKFIAVGTNGRIDWINKSGGRTPVVSPTKSNLNTVISIDQMMIIAGDNGTILYSADGQLFSIVNAGTDKNINGIAVKNGLIVAGTDKGIILVSKNGTSWNSVRTEVKGDIVSLSANDSFFFGISDNGEIIRSNDGLDWDVKDYNKEYSGYNKSCIFKKILCVKNRIVIIGAHEDGSPAVLFSTLGSVWTERLLIYTDDLGIMRYLTSKPNGITYDPKRDQFILACDNGEIFSLPSCTKCNTYAKISDNDLCAIICTDTYLLTVGEGFAISVLRL